MISKERKEEIMAAVAYGVNRHISKQSIESYILDDMDNQEEADWYRENCFGNYIVECGDIK
jgi:hypothetical protein